MARSGNDRSTNPIESASADSGKRRFPFKLALCVALGVGGGLLLLGVAMFVPSYQRYEKALYDRLEHVAWAEASAMLRTSTSNANPSDFNVQAANLYPGALLKGLIVYDDKGLQLGSFGEPIDMPFTPAVKIMRSKVQDHQRYEICWNPAISQTSFHFIARMDSGWIDQELSIFAKETIIRTLAVSLFAAFLILTLMSKMVLQPIGVLRTAMVRASRDLSRAEDYRVEVKAKNEIGDVSNDLNSLFEETAANIRQLEDQRKLASESEGKFGAIFSASHLPIFLIDPEAEKIVEANEAAHQLLRVGGSSLISRFVNEFHPNEMPELREFAASAMGGGKYSTDQLTCTTCDGEVIPAEIFASRVKLDGRTYLMTVVRDLTEAREHEDGLRQAKDLAEMADRTKTEFLANMSHELRTPLNAILGYAEIIAGDVLGKERRDEYMEFASYIHTSGEHLLNIINDILDIAKIEIGEMTLQEKFVYPEDLIDKCRVLIRPRIEEAKLDLVIESDLPLLRLWCDETKIKQVILNILSNSIKFTPSGGKLTLSTKLDSSGCLSFIVADSGVGIPENQLDFIFEPFNQLGDYQTRGTQGTGLGLPIARSLTELHDGILKLESTIGVGTRVTVGLPKSRIEIVEENQLAIGDAAIAPESEPKH